jgi:hypothetical protein
LIESLNKRTALGLSRLAGQELDRAMHEMRAPGFPKPYFISYLLRDEER